MNLIIDVGNSLIKISGFECNNLIMHKIFDAEKINDAQSYFYNVVNTGDAVIYSSVRNEMFFDNKKELKGINVINFNTTTPVPVIVKYETPESLGPDRLAAAIGGNAIFPADNVLVINTGTCITYDFVNKNKEYLGGAISPGLIMRFKALNNFTGKLPLISQSAIKPTLIGNITSDSILSGVINGIVLEIDGFINEYLKLFTDLKIVFSGGDVFYFDKMLKSKIFATENIVSYGLNQILIYNAKSFKP
jgi:type III pantothenate kinase